MIDKFDALDEKIMIAAKLEPSIIDLKSLVKGRWSDMLPQTRKAVESAIASLEAAYSAEKQVMARKVVDHAKQGALQPRPSIKIVHED